MLCYVTSCMSVCMYVCDVIFFHTKSINVCLYVCMYVRICVCVYVCMYVCAYVCMSCMYVCMYRATMACNCSTSQPPTVVGMLCALYILTLKRAIFHHSSGLLAPHPPLWRAYFSTLRSQMSLAKHGIMRLSDFFAHLHLLSSYAFSSTLLASNLPLLPASSLLYVSCVYIVGSLTSKPPSTTTVTLATLLRCNLSMVTFAR